MTHVLDEPIEAAEDAIRESFIFRHDYDPPEPGTPKKQKQEARDSLRSMIAALRILRAEREGRRDDLPDVSCPACGEILSFERGPGEDELQCTTEGPSGPEYNDELRAEGRREERERVVAHLRSLARVAFRSLGAGDAGVLDGVADVTERGDHWRGGEG